MKQYTQIQGAEFAFIPNFPVPGTNLKCRAVMSLHYPYLVARMLMYNPNSQTEGRRIVEIDEGAIPGAVAHPDGMRLYAAPVGVAVGTFCPDQWRGLTDWPTEERRQLRAMCRWFANNCIKQTERYALSHAMFNDEPEVLQESIEKWRARYFGK